MMVRALPATAEGLGGVGVLVGRVPLGHIVLGVTGGWETATISRIAASAADFDV